MGTATHLRHQYPQPMIDVQEKMAAEIGKPKVDYPSFEWDVALVDKVRVRVATRLNEIFEKPYIKAEVDDAINDLRTAAITDLAADDETLADQIRHAFDEALQVVVRQRTPEQQYRTDSG